MILDVRGFRASLREAAAVVRSGKREKGARISFETPELLWRVLTAKRWAILKIMIGAGPMSIREVARRVDRDVKAVHGDVQALLVGGVLDKTQEGAVEFPYDIVKVEFELRANDLRSLRKFRGRQARGFKFDREEANARR